MSVEQVTQKINAGGIPGDRSKKMYKYQITIGLNDKNTLAQKISNADAKKILNNMLFKNFNIYAYTVIDCIGCYQMKNGAIVNENSLRVEIASDDPINYRLICKSLKKRFNQESIMLEKSVENINFI